jgi:hypothetical protein
MEQSQFSGETIKNLTIIGKRKNVKILQIV